MTLRDLFSKRQIGPLSASPIGLAVFCILLTALFVFSYRIMRDRAIADECSELIHFAEPIVTQARWIYEQTGKWPDSIDGLRHGQEAGSLQKFSVQFLQEQGVRVAFNGMKDTQRSITLHVLVRGNDRYLACTSAELPLELVPRFCREMENTRLLEWPPRTAAKPSPP